MTAADRLLDEAAADWTGRWSHPDRARTLSEPGAVPPDVLAGLVTRGLAEPHTPVQTAESLLAEGEFALAERIRADGRLDGDDADRLSRAIDAARRDLRMAHGRVLTTLELRARRLGVVAWPDRDDTERELLDMLLADEPEQATELIRGWERDADKEEGERSKRISERLDAAQRDGSVSATFAQQIRDCLTAGQFDTAEHLVESGRPSPPENAGPRSVPGLVAPLPRPGVPAAEVLEWYERDSPVVGRTVPRLAGWLPERDDVPAWHLVEALRALVAPPAPDEGAASPGPRESEAAAKALTDALHECVGTADEPAVATTRPGGVVVKLRWPGDSRFPAFGLLERTHTPMWVAPADHLPPEDLERPFLWVVPERTVAEAGPNGCVRLTVEDLLRLAAPTGAVPAQATAVRRIGLLRLIGHQLGADHLLRGPGEQSSAGLDLSGRQAPAVTLSWVFDLIGEAPDQVFLEQLLYETGAHPVLLREVITALCPPGRPAGTAEPTPAGLYGLWLNRGWRQRTRDLVLQPYEPNAADLAVLYTAVWLSNGDHRRTFDGVDLVAALAEIARARGQDIDTADLATLVDVEDTLSRLVDTRVLRAHDGGPYGLAAYGLLILFVDLTESELHDRVWAAVSARSRLREQAHAGTLLDITRHIAGIVDHFNRNQQSRAQQLVQAMVDAPDDERASIFARFSELQQQLGSLTDLVERAQRPNTRLSLDDTLRAALAVYEQEFRQADDLRITGDEGLTVFANEWLLFQLFWNLLENARHAIQARPNERDFVWLTVHRVQGRAGDERPWCVVDVEDSGGGFDTDVLERLRRGEQVTTRPNGTGQGVYFSRILAEHYRGELELVGRSERVGGGHVRVRLPLLTP